MPPFTRTLTFFEVRTSEEVNASFFGTRRRLTTSAIRYDARAQPRATKLRLATRAATPFAHLAMDTPHEEERFYEQRTTTSLQNRPVAVLYLTALRRRCDPCETPLKGLGNRGPRDRVKDASPSKKTGMAPHVEE